MMATGIYVIIAEWVSPMLSENAVADDMIATLRLVFGFVAVFLLFGSVMIRRRFLSKIQNGQSEFPNQTYMTGVIVSLAMAENVAVLGLVLKLLGDATDIFYLFILSSAFFLFLNRPQEHQLTDSV